MYRRIACGGDHRKLPAFVTIVGVFVNHPDPQGLEDFALSLGLHAVQLHGNESPDYCSMIQRVKVIKAIRMDSNFKVESLRSFGNRMFLLDSATPAQFGGTGQTFNWSQAYGANAFGSIVIAGGLNPENVRRCGIESPSICSGCSQWRGVPARKKDYEKMRRFIEAVRRVDVALLGAP